MGNQSLVTLPVSLDSYLKRDRYWPPRSRRDIVIPHRGESIGWLRAVPGLITFFDRRVPPEFWTEGSDGDGPIITIACRCGESPVLHFGLRSYSIAECLCGRFFLHDGHGIRVGHDPEKLPRADPEPAIEPEEVEPPPRPRVPDDIAWQP